MIRPLLTKDWRGLFRSPLIFLLLAGFLLIVNYLFVLLMLTVGMDGFMPVVLDNIANLSLVLVPVLVLKLVGEEWVLGTDEWLLTQPIRPIQVIIAKFWAVFLTAAFFVGLTFCNLGVLAYFCDPAWGPIAAGYLGVFLFIAVLAAIGIAISVWARSAMLAAGGTFVVGLLLMAMGWLADSPIAQWFPWLSHFMMGRALVAFQEGTISVSAIGLFGGVIGSALALAWVMLSQKPLFNRVLVIGTGAMVVALTVLLPGKWEWSDAQWMTLSRETVHFAKSQKTRIQISVWVYFDSYEHRYLKPILDGYHQANSDIQVQFLDPDRHPQLAAKYTIDGPGTLIFESGNRVRRAHSSEIFQFDEEKKLEMLAAEPVINREIMALQSDRVPEVAVLEGHGEHPIIGGRTGDLDRWAALLKRNHMSVSTLNLTVLPLIGESVDLVVIAGAALPVSPIEWATLKRFNSRGGAVLILAEPREYPQVFDPLVPLTISPNIVVDESRSHFYDMTSIVPQPIDHPLNTVLSEQNLAIGLSVATALWPVEHTPKEWTPLFVSSPHAWLAPDVTQDVQRQFSDTQPHIFSVAAEYRKGKNGPIIVMGDSDWITNKGIAAQYNEAYALRLVSFLVDHTIGSLGKTRSRAVQEILIRPGEDKVIFGLLVILFPGFVAAFGGWRWIRRRAI